MSENSSQWWDKMWQHTRYMALRVGSGYRMRVQVALVLEETLGEAWY